MSGPGDLVVLDLVVEHKQIREFLHTWEEQLGGKLECLLRLAADPQRPEQVEVKLDSKSYTYEAELEWRESVARQAKQEKALKSSDSACDELREIREELRELAVRQKCGMESILGMLAGLAGSVAESMEVALKLRFEEERRFSAAAREGAEAALKGRLEDERRAGAAEASAAALMRGAEEGAPAAARMLPAVEDSTQKLLADMPANVSSAVEAMVKRCLLEGEVKRCLLEDEGPKATDAAQEGCAEQPSLMSSSASNNTRKSIVEDVSTAVRKSIMEDVISAMRKSIVEDVSTNVSKTIRKSILEDVSDNVSSAVQTKIQVCFQEEALKARNSRLSFERGSILQPGERRMRFATSINSAATEATSSDGRQSGMNGDRSTRQEEELYALGIANPYPKRSKNHVGSLATSGMKQNRRNADSINDLYAGGMDISRFMTRRPSQRNLWLEWRKKWMDRVSMALIFSNTLYMAVEAEIRMSSALREEKPPVWLWWGNAVFAAAFVCELACKVCIQGNSFCREDRAWNTLDIFLVTISICDVALELLNVSFVRSLRIIRAVRVTRALQTIHHVQQLRLMVASIISSLPSLAWAFVLLMLLLYLYALLIMQGVELFIRDEGLQHAGILIELYGHISTSVLTLFMAISGGRDWGETCEPLRQVSVVYVVLFVMFVTFVVFGVVNILTAVFIDASAGIIDVDRDLVVQRHQAHVKSTMRHLQRLFEEADIMKTGVVSRQQVLDMFDDKETLALLKTLGLEVEQAHQLVKLLDMDGDDEIEIGEFVLGLMRVRGAAKGMDLERSLLENKANFIIINDALCKLSDTVEAMKFNLAPPPLSTRRRSSLGACPVGSIAASPVGSIAESQT